jgi:gliding motility-associated lipoprotein GldH
MWMYIKTPGDSLVKKERVNILLAGPTGKWLGRGLGTIYEERVVLDLGDSVRFNKAGTYEIALEQNMRINPLPEVLHVGFRLEKFGQGYLKNKN